MRKIIILCVVVGLGVVGCKGIPPKVATLKGEDGLTYTYINTGTDSPGKVMKGIVVTDSQGNIVNSAFTDSPKLKEAVIAGAAQGAPVVVATTIGGFWYKEGQRKRRPDQSNTNIIMANDNDADSGSLGNIGGGAAAFSGAKAFSSSSSKASTVQKQLQKQVMIDD